LFVYVLITDPVPKNENDIRLTVLIDVRTNMLHKLH